MTAFTAANYLNNSGRTEAEMKQAFEDNLAATKQLPGASTGQSLTIAAGSVTPAGGAALYLIIDTEGAASTDDLTNVVQTNTNENALLWITVAHEDRTVVLKHAAGGGGQLSLRGAVDFTMDTAARTILLVRVGLTWYELGRFYGNDGAGHRAFYGAAGFGQNTFTGRQEWKLGAALASAATLTLGTDGNVFHVTGTTTINGLSSTPAGTVIGLIFDASLQVTHNATSLILSDGASYQTEAGNCLVLVSEGAGNYRELARSNPGNVRVLNRVTADVSVNNSAVETIVYSFSVPGGILKSNRRLVLRIDADFVEPDGSNSLTVRLKYGSATAIVSRIISGTTAGHAITQEFWLSGDGATNVQRGTILPVAIQGSSGVNVFTAASGAAGIDSTLAQTIEVTVQWTNNETDSNYTLRHAVLELL